MLFHPNLIQIEKRRPYSLAQEVAIIWAASNGFLDNLDLNKVEEFELNLLKDLKTKGKSWVEKVEKNKILDKKDEEQLKKLVTENLVM